MTPDHHIRLEELILFLKSIGCQHAVVSPGSRNAPVIGALNRVGLDCFSVLDERSAAYQAMGMSIESKAPVILSCTSGTAALNYGPAIAEAFYSQVPLIVLTADRPASEIDQWDGQAVRQRGVFKNHIIHEFEYDVSGKECDRIFSQISELQLNGPIHINLPLTEPLYNFSSKWASRYFDVVKQPSRHYEVHVNSLQNYLNKNLDGSKVLIFQGMPSAEHINLLSERHPVLNDVTHPVKGSISYWDLVLQSDLQLPDLAPEILITSGTTTVSKAIKTFLRAHPPKVHYHISSDNHVGNMFHTSPIVISPSELDFSKVEEDTMSEYKRTWLRADEQAGKAFEIQETESFNELEALRELLTQIDSNFQLHASNSLPVRYLSWMGYHGVQCNRGTSGIDGCTSTAIGAAKISNREHILITGDLAFQYDSNAFWDENKPKNLKVVVLNNHGGGIFKVIDGPARLSEAEIFQTTPHKSDFSGLAEHYELKYFCARNWNELKSSIKRWKSCNDMSIMEISTELNSATNQVNRIKQIRKNA